MSKIVAIITEYNPFHNGHKYQIEKIREEIPDSTIISIMSGNTVQRGEFAFVDKYVRAEMAIKCGVDAVFELPFPYCCSTAEIFANSGVEIAYKLGADYLYFGTESDDINKLEKIADVLNTDEYNSVIRKILETDTQSFPKAREIALKQMNINLTNLPNDILAIEYIRAIKNKKIPLRYNAIKRIGSGYNDMSICEIMSASAIRESYYNNGTFLSLPHSSYELLKNESDKGRIIDVSLANKIMLAHILTTTPEKIENKFDVPCGMGYFIHQISQKCKEPEHFTNELSSKSYTSARLRRAIFYSLFDIENIDKNPDFTILLGANEKGKKVIKKCIKTDSFVIVSKYNDCNNLNENSKQIYEKNLLSDKIFSMCCKNSQSPLNSYQKKPFII